MKLLIIPNLDKPNAAICTKRTLELLCSYGCTCFMDEAHEGAFAGTGAVFETFDRALGRIDMVVAIGGDGTILHSAKHAVAADKPILGINVGRLGFLAQIEPTQEELLLRLVQGRYAIQRRMMLEALVEGRLCRREILGFNDIVVTRGSFSRMLDLQVLCDGSVIENVRADGLIFSTPTGSTAYSLSAGGPIVDPIVSCIIMTPICPHSLLSRPVIFADRKELTVHIGEMGGHEPMEPYITADGGSAVPLYDGDSITIRRARQTVQFVSFEDRSFYEVLSSKLTAR